jgi:sterol desaturase/sphingolipid hydroxylase (fatty acid hydroxylase superfamily)
MQHFLANFGLDLVRLSAWLVLLIVIFVPLERLRPIHSQKIFRRAFGTDVVYYFLSGLAPKLLLVLPMTLIAQSVHRVIPSAFYESVSALPLWIRLIAAMIVGELGAYWAHRWSHEIPLLWRFHAIHHSAEEIDWLVNTRVHPVDLVFTRLCDMVPMYILGLAQPMANQLDLVPVLVIVAGTMWGFFIHANVNWRLGFLERLISSPAFHHWHHSINKNYAPMLPWVDKIFGTLYLPEQWPEKYGIDTPIAATLTGQLAALSSFQRSSDPVEHRGKSYPEAG